MNYLAHLFLSRQHPDAVMGNFLTDMMTISEIKKWPGKFDSGVLLHRRIDAFTDRHEANITMKRILRPYFHKYAGVALDLYYDYILGQNWELYSDMSFPVFTQTQYHIFQSHEDAIPSRLQIVVKRMIAGDFLHRYITIGGQAFAFSSMDRRARFETGFEKAIEVLELHMDDLTKHFHLFFPDMMESAESFLNG